MNEARIPYTIYRYRHCERSEANQNLKHDTGLPRQASGLPRNEGFTLIELSIVLVIIGLIVGGVLVGRDLIDAAKVRGTVAQVDRYKAAYQTFRLKYNCIPGDCKNASTFGLNGGFYYNVNGDGDKLIYSYSDGTVLASTLSKYAETWGALAHLGSAGLIEKTYTNGMAAGTSNLPIEGAFMLFTSLRPTTPPSGYIMPDSAGNYLQISQYPVNGQEPGYVRPVLTPEQAFAIDNKIDDGLPMSGGVRATTQYNLCPSISIPSQTWGSCFNDPFKTSQTGLYGAGPAASAPVNDSVTPPVYNFNAPPQSSDAYQTLAKASIHIRVD